MLVFFIIILVLFLIIYLLALIVYLSTIEIEIKRLEIEKKQKEKPEINDIIIRAYLKIGKIKYFRITINKEKLEKLNYKNKNLLQTRKQYFNSNYKLKINLEKLDFNLELGSENIIALTYIVTLLNIFISIFLGKIANKINSKDYQYRITPIKTKEIYFNLSINCIFSIKIANIINVVLKKRGKNDDGTSNRIFDGNSYEQYRRHGRCKYNNRRTYIYR